MDYVSREMQCRPMGNFMGKEGKEGSTWCFLLWNKGLARNNRTGRGGLSNDLLASLADPAAEPSVILVERRRSREIEGDVWAPWIRACPVAAR